MKTIAAFSEVGIGGAERVFLEYCSKLARRGWDVRVIAGGRLDAEALRIWRGWGPGLAFSELPWRRRSSYRCPVILPSLDRKAVGGFRNLLAGIRPDLVLINQPGADDAQGAIRAAAGLSWVPVACLVHMPALGRVRLWRTKRWWARRLYRRVDLVVANSGATAASLADNYSLPDAKLRVVWNGVKDPGAFPPQARALLRGAVGASDEDILVLWAGRFTGEKAADVLLASMREVRRGARIKLALAGEGPLRECMQADFAPLVESGTVRFLGWRQDVAELIDACDIAVLPSRIESFGLFTVEAMAARKPVIATKVYGIPDVVIDGKTGCLVPPDDPSSLASAIERLAGDAALRKELGLAGRERYEELFTFEKAADRFERALLSTMDL